MTEDGNEIANTTEIDNAAVVENQNDLSKLSEDELEARNKVLEKIRTYHPLKILSLKEARILASLKEDELSFDEGKRIKLATLRLSDHKYTGTDYTPKEKKKIKARKKLIKASRKANR